MASACAAKVASRGGARGARGRAARGARAAAPRAAAREAARAAAGADGGADGGRRAALFGGAAAALSLGGALVAPRDARAASEFGVVADEINAYEFAYPTTTTTGERVPWFVARRPRAYADAPPLAPDGRAKIVFEQISLQGSAVISVAVTPLKGARFVGGKDEAEWSARDVANAVLTDRSVGRIATGERYNLEDIDASTTVEGEDGVTYYLYETSRIGAPRQQQPKGGDEVTKCASATALRGGYFYSVKFTLPERVWDAGGGDLARAATASFRLTPTTRKFRKPDEGLVSISVPTPF